MDEVSFKYALSFISLVKKNPQAQKLKPDLYFGTEFLMLPFYEMAKIVSKALFKQLT